MNLKNKFRFTIPDYLAKRFNWGKHESNLALCFKPKLKIFSKLSCCLVFYKYKNPIVIFDLDDFVPFKSDGDAKEIYRNIQEVINPSENNQ